MSYILPPCTCLLFLITVGHTLRSYWSKPQAFRIPGEGSTHSKWTLRVVGNRPHEGDSEAAYNILYESTPYKTA